MLVDQAADPEMIAWVCAYFTISVDQIGFIDDRLIKNYDINDGFGMTLFTSDYSLDRSLPIVIEPVYTEGTDGVLNHYFTFNGNKEEAQQYLDELFSKNGLDPLYNVFSMTELYDRSKSQLMIASGKQIGIALISLSAYVVIAKQMIESYLKHKARTFLIMRIEGHNPYLFTLDLLVFNFIIFPLIEVVFFVQFGYPLLNLLLSLSIFLLIECGLSRRKVSSSFKNNYIND